MPFVATPESLAKMSASQKKRLADPVKSAYLRGPRPAAQKPKSEEHKAALKASWTPERRAKHAARMKGNDRWKTHGESSIERQTREWLTTLNVAFVQHARVCGFWVDFLVDDLVIECDGQFWHGREGIPERDEMKDRTWRAAGYRVLRLPEAQIKDGSALIALKEGLDG